MLYNDNAAYDDDLLYDNDGVIMTTVHNTRIKQGYNNNDDDVEDTTTTMRNDEYHAKRMRYDMTTRIHLQGYDNEDTTTRLQKQLLIRHGGEMKMRE